MPSRHPDEESRASDHPCMHLKSSARTLAKATKELSRSPSYGAAKSQGKKIETHLEVSVTPEKMGKGRTSLLGHTKLVQANYGPTLGVKAALD